MADLEDGEILDSSEDETKNVPQNTAKNNVNRERTYYNTYLASFRGKIQIS